MNPQVVLVFGDSIVMGLWDERGGWPERLWDGRSRIVYNLGVDGETSEDVRKRFESEAKSRANKNSIIIFAVGINDSSRIGDRNRVNLSDYVRNMGQLIDRARELYSNKILCVGLDPIDQTKTVPFVLERTISFLTADRDEYDSALNKATDSKGATYVSLSNLGLESHLSEDGVHPVSSGHALIAQKVMEMINRHI